MPRSAADIQRHLYSALLHGRTPDVSLCVRASWHATYRLHRIILIQAGFFNSLFTAGFAESSPQPEEIDIIFDDPNITRAGMLHLVTSPYTHDLPAFEYVVHGTLF
jgi:hypothetical protein